MSKGTKICIALVAGFSFFIIVLAFALYDGCYEPYISNKKFISDLEEEIIKIEKQNEKMKLQADEIVEIKASKSNAIERYKEVEECNEKLKLYLQ